jgi:hypothetical protein
MSKLCPKCGQIKEDIEFNRSSYSSSGLSSWCKDCNKEQCRKHNNSRQGQKNALKRNLSRYNLTIEEFDRLSEAQDNLCAICSKSEEYFPRLSVDHCHETGKVRGLLCNNCNRGLGLLGDNHETLKKASEYLLGARNN